jgi:hypothetical protein
MKRKSLGSPDRAPAQHTSSEIVAIIRRTIVQAERWNCIVVDVDANGEYRGHDTGHGLPLGATGTVPSYEACDVGRLRRVHSSILR